MSTVIAISVLLTFLILLIMLLGGATAMYLFGYYETRDKELLLERLANYFENKGKELAERRNRRIKK